MARLKGTMNIMKHIDYDCEFPGDWICVCISVSLLHLAQFLHLVGLDRQVKACHLIVVETRCGDTSDWRPVIQLVML